MVFDTGFRWRHRKTGVEPLRRTDHFLKKRQEMVFGTKRRWRRLASHVSAKKKEAAKASFFAARSAGQFCVRNVFSLSEREGWRSLLIALASIWRIRSRVTSNCLPTSSSVWSFDISTP